MPNSPQCHFVFLDYVVTTAFKLFRITLVLEEIMGFWLVLLFRSLLVPCILWHFMVFLEAFNHYFTILFIIIYGTTCLGPSIPSGLTK